MKSRPFTRREDGKSNWKRNKPTCAAVSQEATSGSRRVLLTSVHRGGAAELPSAAGATLQADSGWGRPPMWASPGVAPVGPTVPFPSIRFIVRIETRTIMCLQGLSAGQINLGGGTAGEGVGWGEGRKNSSRRALECWEWSWGKPRNWPFSFINHQNHCN